MKKLLLSLSVVAFLGTLVSCSKDDSGPSNVFTAEIDGDEFSADEIEGYFYSSDDEVEVYGYTEDDENGFVIYFSTDEVEEGETYDFSDLEISIAYFDEDDNVYFPVSGEMDVTTLTDSRFEATFEFDGEDFSSEEIEVTDGVVKSDLEEDN
jgi:hypothetical protein